MYLFNINQNSNGNNVHRIHNQNQSQPQSLHLSNVQHAFVNNDLSTITNGQQYHVQSIDNSMPKPVPLFIGNGNMNHNSSVNNGSINNDSINSRIFNSAFTNNNNNPLPPPAATILIISTPTIPNINQQYHNNAITIPINITNSHHQINHPVQISNTNNMQNVWIDTYEDINNIYKQTSHHHHHDQLSMATNSNSTNSNSNINTNSNSTHADVIISSDDCSNDTSVSMKFSNDLANIGCTNAFKDTSDVHGKKKENEHVKRTKPVLSIMSNATPCPSIQSDVKEHNVTTTTCSRFACKICGRC